METALKLLRNKKAIAVIVICTITVIALVIGFNYTVVTIELTDGDNKEFTVGISEEKQTAKKRELIGKGIRKTLLVKRAESMFHVSQSDRETILKIALRPFWSGQKNILLKNRVGIEKLSADSLGCSANTSAGLLTYRCNGTSEMFRYDRSGRVWENKQLVNTAGLTFKQPRGYLDGILFANTSFESSPTNFEVVFSNFVGPPKRIVPPNDLRGSSVDEILIVTDTVNVSNRRFFVVSKENLTGFLYQSIDDTNPRKIDLKNKISMNPTYFVRCSAFNAKLSCIYGPGKESVEAGTAEEGGHQATLLEYEEAPLATEIPPSRSSDVIYQADTNTLVGISSDKVLRITSRESIIASYGGVDDVAVGSEGILFVSGNSLYLIDRDNPSQAILVVKSDSNMVISRISANGGDYLLEALQKDLRSQPLHTYRILFAKQFAENGRETAISDLARGVGGVEKTDYYGTSLFVKLSMSSYESDRETGELIVNQDELKAKQSLIYSSLDKTNARELFDKIIITY